MLGLRSNSLSHVVRRLLLCVCCLLARAVETIPLYTVYADPPYAVADAGNLTTQLASWLTLHADGRYVFVATQLPRRRLDLLLGKPDWPGVVAWANPAWFGDPEQSRYAWSQAYMQDSDLVVSRSEKPLEYEAGGQSLLGLKLGGVIGHRYVEIEALLQTGEIQRDDATSELQSLLKLQHGRVDFCFMQASALPYFRHTLPGFAQWAHIARESRARYQRYLFASKARPGLIRYLDEQLERLEKDTGWQAILRPLP